MDYLRNYLSVTEYEYITSKLEKKYLDLFIINNVEIMENLEYLKTRKVNIKDVIDKRLDLIICSIEELTLRMDKIEDPILNKLEVEDFILFGI